MAYFSHTENCHHYPDEWEALLNYIKSSWPAEQVAHLGDLNHHIEAKALYVFTMAQRIMKAANKLSQDYGWQPIFTEAATLIFPLIELVGEARLGNATNNSAWRPLASGIDWLIDPVTLPAKNRTPHPSTDSRRVNSLGNFMPTLPSGPTVQELYHLRNYLAHGLKEIRSSSGFSIEALQTSMNFELPNAIIHQARVGLATYWRQLRNPDGSEQRDWITRLAEAHIYPFRIVGSGIYEAGIIDPHIVYWLSDL